MEAMKDLVIIGAGGFGREVKWLVDRINAKKPEWNLLGFIDNTPEKQGIKIDGLKVLGYREWIEAYDKTVFAVCSIAVAKARKKVIEEFSKFDNLRFATLVDPSVIKSDSISIGEGAIVCAGSILTVNIEIGKHTIINLDCTFGHDAKISDYCTFYPSVNVSGNATIGQCTEMGTGSLIIEKLEIGSGTIVGAGAVVAKSLPSMCTAVGIPAKPIKFHDETE